MKNPLKVVLLVVLVAIIAIAVTLLWPSGSADAQVVTDEDRCDGRVNHYVSQPVVAASNGKVTHTLKDIFGNSYNYNDDKGGWGRGRVLGYHVKSDGPHSWVWRSGSTTTISYGQVVKACIEQKVKPHWHSAPGAKPWNWYIVSPEVSRPQG